MENDWKIAKGHLICAIMVLISFSSNLMFTESTSICDEEVGSFLEECKDQTMIDDGCVNYDMTFETASIEFEEDECVRLHFRKYDEQHFIADSLTVPDLNLSYSFDLTHPSSVVFTAPAPGEYAFSSTGMCQIDIPGAGSVIVDCAIFCGKTSNTESGVFSVQPKAGATAGNMSEGS